MLKKFKKWIDEIRDINSNPVMSVLPGQLAFFFVLSIPPLISLVGIIGSALSLSTEGFLTFINESFPASTSSLIIPIINGNGINSSILIFIIGALFMVSKGTNAVIITSNTLYKIDESDKIKRQIKSLFLVMMLVILMAFIIVVPVFGDTIMALLKNIDQINNIFSELMIVYNAIKLPITFIFIYFIIKLIYTIAPDKLVKSRDVTFGALFTTTIWIIATKLYTYYVINFAKYDIFYGNIANLIILLLWIYLLSYIFVLGMALNVTTHSLELNKEKRR
jgi:membrane protein